MSTSASNQFFDPALAVDLESDEQVLAAIRSVDWNFTKSKTDYYSHGLHPYPAKFIPQIPNALITLLSARGDLVWDPFGGSGTTALEALLLGRRALSTDLNPVAEVIGKAKTTTLTPEIEVELTQLALELRTLSASNELVSELAKSRMASENVPEIPNLEKWFEPSAVKELSYLRAKVSHLSHEGSKRVALACFSKEVLAASNQDAETRYAAVAKNIKPGGVVHNLARSLLSALDGLGKQAKQLQFRTAEFFTADVRSEIVGVGENAIISPSTVDLVVTSPPYPNATDYHLYHRFRIFWLGHDPRQVANAEIGSHLRHQKQNTAFDSYLDEMRLVLKNVERALKPGGLAVIVVGDAVFKKELFRTAEALSEVSESVGLRTLGIIDRDLPENKRSFIRAARRLRSEQLLVIRKPGELVSVTLCPPPYKLQPYEDALRKAEATTLIGKVSVRGDCLMAKASPGRAKNARRLAFSSLSQIGEGVERSWQAALENGDASGRNRKDPKYVTHGIHPYKGKFYPQLAKALMNSSGQPPGGLVLDPFCGSGTVLLESALNGWNAIGFDVNPVAVATANAKVGLIHGDAVFRDHLLCTFERKVQSLIGSRLERRRLPYSDEAIEEIESWFPGPVVSKIANVLSEIDAIIDANTRELLRVIVSSIIREVSQQEPRDLRIRRREKPIDDAPVYELILERTRDVRRKLSHFAKVSCVSPVQFGHGRSVLATSSDQASFAAAGLSPGAVDMVVTSPPYATALPYIDTDRLSLLICHGMTSSARREAEDRLIGSREIRTSTRKAIEERIESSDFEPLASHIAATTISKIYTKNLSSDAGFRKRNTAALLYIYFDQMHRVAKNVSSVVKSGGSAFVVIGDTRTTAGGEDVPIRSGRAIEEQFHSLGWKTEKVLPITVTRENVVHSKNSITDNEIYWFKKL